MKYMYSNFTIKNKLQYNSFTVMFNNNPNKIIIIIILQSY